MACSCDAIPASLFVEHMEPKIRNLPSTEPFISVYFIVLFNFSPDLRELAFCERD